MRNGIRLFIAPWYLFGVLFNLFLVQLGLGFPVSDGMTDLLVNRLPNLLFIALQIPLFWGDFTRSLPAVIAGCFKCEREKR